MYLVSCCIDVGGINSPCRVLHGLMTPAVSGFLPSDLRFWSACGGRYGYQSCDCWMTNFPRLRGHPYFWISLACYHRLSFLERTSARTIVWWVPTRASRSRRILIVWSRPILNIIASNSGSLTFRRLIIPFSPLLTETLAANAYNADDYEDNRKYNDKHGDNCLAIQRFISLIVYADPILSFARKWHLIILLKQINWKRPPEQWFFIIFLLIILFLINILFIIVFVVYWTKPARAFWIPIAIVSLSFTALADI